MQYTKEVAVLEAAFQLARKHIADVVRSSVTSLGDASPGDTNPEYTSFGDASLGDFYQGDTRKKVADTLVTAINEIVAGLEYPSSQAEKDHVSFVMHSILFDCFSKDVLCMINGSRNNTCHNPLDAFPRIGCRLYYIILVRLNWGHLFGQIVSPLPVDQAKLILQIFLHLIIEEPQEKVEDFVAEIVRGMLPDAPTNTHSIVVLVLSGQQSQKIVQPDKFRNLLVFFDILFSIKMKELEDSKRKDSIEDPDDSKGNDSILYKIASSCISHLIMFLESHIGQELGMIKEQPHSWQLCTVQPHSRQHCIGQPHTKPHAVKSTTDIPIQFYQKLQQILTSDELENTFNFGSMADNSTDGSIDELHVFMEDLLCCLNGSIGAWGQEVPDALKPFNPANQGRAMFLEKCYQLLTIWKTLCKEPEEIERTFPHLAMLESEFKRHFQVEEKEKRLDGSSEQTHIVEDVLKTAIWRVDNRLLGYQESLMWILNNASCYNTDELWISCLERNVTSFRSLKLLQCLVDCTIQQQLIIGGRTQSTIVERLLMVLLKSFEMVSIGIQNRVRDYFTQEQHKHLSVYLYEEYTASSLQHQVIVAFNKLVNSSNSNNVQELLQYVGPIAFQSPRQTIQKAVMESVNNAGVIPLVSQIFQGMTSLCSYKEHKKTVTFLCVTLYDNAVRLSSHKHQTNFMNLTKTLLQSFKPPMHPNYPFLKSAVLSCQELLEVCIFPNLYHHNDNFHGENIHGLQGDYLHGDYLNGGHIQGGHLHGTMHPRINLLLSLQLLKIILDTSKSGTTIAESIERDHIFPIMLCLASFINESIVLWDANVECVNKEDVKELSKTLLQILCKTLNEQWTENDNEGLRWLMFKVRSFHWSVELYLRFLLADCLSDKDIAAQFSISSFFNTEWNTTHLKSECLERNILAFLQCCQIWPTIGEIQLQSIFHHDIDDGLLIALVRALVQLLPQCTQPEWSNITKMLEKLLERKIIHVPLSARFIRELPLIDFKEYAVQLGISSLFLMIFELLGSESCPWSHTTGLWQHTLKCYVNVMKDLLGNIQECSSTNQARGFLIGQLFCHNLEVMGYIPESVKGQLFVLTLELVSMLEELTEKTLKETFFATKQDRIFQKLVRRMTEGDDKNTLQQKLKTLNMIL